MTLIIGVFVADGTARAQERHVGAKVGPSFASLAFQPDESGGYDRRLSADGGGFVVLPIARRIALQLEALLTSRGAELFDAETNLTGTILLQYFDVPMLVRIQGPTPASRSIHLFAGPFASVRTSARRQVSTYVGSIRTGEAADISPEIERFGFGWLVGAGVDIGRWIVVDGRYSHGITALNTDRSEGFRVRNRAITVMAGVRY